MASQEHKRQRTADLLRAHLSPKKVSTVVGVSLKTVYNVRKAINSGNGIQRKLGSGGSNRKRTPEFLDALKSKIKQEPTTPMKKLAMELDVDRKTVQTAINSDLGFKSFVRTPRHLLTKSMQEKRLERCQKVLGFLKRNGSTVRVFSDEKIFTVDAVVNRRNDRYIAASRAEVKGIFRTKHPAQVMVFGVVASDGKKMPPYFFKPGEKVGAESYYKVLRYHVLPWLKANYPQGDYVWTQDGAPCHTATKVQEFCRKNFADFWAKDLWPPSSPDLNPLDYAVWGVLEARVNKTSHPNTESLKTAIKEAWADLSDDFIVNSCRSFRSRVEAVISNNGGHIE